jgi:hypothetical protein
LPNRRKAETTELAVNGTALCATVGFNEAGRPAEIFLTGAKDGPYRSPGMTLIPNRFRYYSIRP